MDNYVFSGKRALIFRVLFLIISFFMINLLIKSVLSSKLFFFTLLLIFLNVFFMFQPTQAVLSFFVQIPFFSRIVSYGHGYSSFALEISLLTILVVFFIKMVFSKEIVIKKAIVYLPMLFFLGISFFSLITVLYKSSDSFFSLVVDLFFLNPQPLYSFGLYSPFLCFRYFFTIFEGILLFFLVINVLSYRELFEKKKFLVFIFSLIVFPLFIVGSYQMFFLDNVKFFHGINRAWSFMNDPNSFGGYLIAIIPLTISLFFWFENLKYRYFLAVLIFCEFLLLIFSFSRGAFFGLAVGAVSAMIIKPVKLKRFGKFFLLFLFFIFLLFIFLINYDLSAKKFFESNAYVSKFVSPFDFNKSLQYRTTGRWYVWQAAINMIRENPFFGIGIGNFFMNVNKYYPKDIKPWAFYHNAHNYYLQIAAEIGIFGLVSFLLIIFFTLFHGIMKYKKFKKRGSRVFLLGSLVSFISMSIHSLVDNHLLRPGLFFLFCFIIALIFLADDSKKHFLKARGKDKNV